MPRAFALVERMTSSAVVPCARVLTIVLRQLVRMSTIGAKMTFTPSGPDSRPETRPVRYETSSLLAASHWAPVAMYVPSAHAPLPPDSQFAAMSSGIVEADCSELSSSCTWAALPPWYRAPPIPYVARISSLLPTLALNVSWPKWNRLKNSWPTFCSRVSPAMVVSTQSRRSSSSSYGTVSYTHLRAHETDSYL